MKKALICLLLVYGLAMAKAGAEETTKSLWVAHCTRAAQFGSDVIFELKSAPTPWHGIAIQFTTTSGQKIIITSGSSCIFRKVPRR